MDPFLIRILIAIGVYFFFNLIITEMVTEAQAAKLFRVILLIACVLYLLLGSFLPFK